MRISTSQIFQAGVRQITDGQSKLYKLQNQLASGKRFESAQEDPVAAAQVLLTTQSSLINKQFADNQANASSQLGLEEDRLATIIEGIQTIREKVIAGNNSSYSDSQRKAIATELQSQFDSLLAMANSTDANGYYLFSGFQGSTKPFQLQADGSVQYAGDGGQRMLQVGTSRQIPVSDSGRSVFETRTGNGTFALGASASNTGTGVVSGGSLRGPAAWTGDSYQIQFTSATSYTVTNTTTSAVVGTYDYAGDTEITGVPGASFSISGTPAAGDTFSVAPSTNQSVFTTLQTLITAFSTSTDGNAALGASVRNTVNTEMSNLNQIFNNLSSVQTAIGSRRSELESLTDASSALELHYQERINDLQGINEIEIISAFAQQSQLLEAAQSSFAKISALTLFSYL